MLTMTLSTQLQNLRSQYLRSQVYIDNPKYFVDEVS